MSSNNSLVDAMNEEINLAPYDSNWPLRFSAEKKRLLLVFSDTLLEIEHIGSTSVPNLSAKPIIDIMASVASMKEAHNLLVPLCGYGYATSEKLNAGLNERLWLLRHSGGHRTHHLHLVVQHSYGWNRTIKFRDALRADAGLAKEYQRLKTFLVNCTGNDRDMYTKAKTQFIEEVVRKQIRDTH